MNDDLRILRVPRMLIIKSTWRLIRLKKVMHPKGVQDTGAAAVSHRVVDPYRSWGKVEPKY